MLSILIIDDEKNVRNFLVELLKEDYITYTASNYEESIQIIRNYSPDIILLDIIMPEINGIEILKKIKFLYPNQLIIMITGAGTIETAISSIKEGAFDYLTKPFDINEIRRCISKVQHTLELENEIKLLKKEIETIYPSHKIIGESESLKDIFRLIEKIAHTSAIVLIEGETGVGKELIARRIHHVSNRKNKPFITVDCGVIPENLFESELFGYEKGAFTGAVGRKPGRVEMADGGTLFIDEIGNLKLDLQTKLLRLIQEKEFVRLGGTKTIRTDIRLIAATNKKLETLIKNNQFREDLYYRLNVININVLPLRERKEDIPLLINYFLNYFCLENKKPIFTFSNKLINELKNYSWPGNIRELKNFIERIVVLSNKNFIDTNDIPDDFFSLMKKKDKFQISFEEPFPTLKEFSDIIKNKYINYIHTKTKNDFEKTSKILNINKSYLKNLITLNNE